MKFYQFLEELKPLIIITIIIISHFAAFIAGIYFKEYLKIKKKHEKNNL